MNVSGKVFVVTGAGNGIGRVVTQLLLENGATVAGVDLNSEGLAKTADLVEAGARFSSHVVNITDREQVLALPAAVTGAHGNVDSTLR